MQSKSGRVRFGVLLMSGTVLIAGSHAADEQKGPNVAVQYADDFSYASGGKQTQLNGQDPITEGTVHCSMFTYGRPHIRATGDLRLSMTEDNLVDGFDGKPGVLRMEMNDLPIATDYTGFVITGNSDSGSIAFPDWTPGDVTMEDLNRTFVSLRFRSENREEPEQFSMPLSFRLEPQQEGSFPFAADFGTLVPTLTWRTLKRPIGSAKNVEAFLANVNQNKTKEYKLVWSQIGPISLYQPGDGILIDDLKITMEEPPSN